MNMDHLKIAMRRLYPGQNNIPARKVWHRIGDPFKDSEGKEVKMSGTKCEAVFMLEEQVKRLEKKVDDE
jgi:hypothetical protein